MASDLRSPGDRAAAPGDMFAGVLPAASVREGPVVRAARRSRGLLAALPAFGAALLLLAMPLRAHADTIAAQRIFERGLDIWFGTLTVVGAPAFSQDFVELGDFVTDGLRFQIEHDPLVDDRVRAELGNTDAWVNPGQTNIEWVLSENPTPANLPAQQNLLDAHTAAALALFGPGVLTPGAPTEGMASYLLTRIETTESGPVVAGTVGNPVVVGSEGDTVIVTNDFVGIVHYFNQDAVWTLDARSVPEPGTLGLLALALAALAARAGRSPSRG